ncbi:MAG TPA: S4 domain-containing protein [Rhodanobacteraceae bacterium]|nr:S4 domain-containing protein [Rhodanobacteraceae bacterium]
MSRGAAGTVDAAAAVRADVWLWAARFFKTRALARQALETGHVDVGDLRCKAGRVLRVGETLHIRRGEERFEVLVLALSARRGPTAVAQTLYAETDASRLGRALAQEQRRLQPAPHPEARPGKHDRRALRALKSESF